MITESLNNFERSVAMLGANTGRYFRLIISLPRICFLKSLLDHRQHKRKTQF